MFLLGTGKVLRSTCRLAAKRLRQVFSDEELLAGLELHLMKCCSSITNNGYLPCPKSLTCINPIPLLCAKMKTKRCLDTAQTWQYSLAIYVQAL